MIFFNLFLNKGGSIYAGLSTTGSFDVTQCTFESNVSELGSL